MIHVLVVLVALVALLVPAPFALAHGSRAVHARRHAACLRRIEALEIDLGMREPPRTLDDRMHEFLGAAVASSRADREREKVWKQNRKRLSKIPPSPYRRRARD